MTADDLFSASLIRYDPDIWILKEWSGARVERILGARTYAGRGVGLVRCEKRVVWCVMKSREETAARKMGHPHGRTCAT